jgi:hypothetical protein
LSDISVITGINGVMQQVTYDDRIYDLSGRRLSQEPEKGIYIRNGMKFMK